MPSLPTPLRKTLEGAVTKARREAEDAARAALDTLTVDQRTFHALSFADRRLRNSLRARARQLSGHNDVSTGMAPLVEEVAYAQWHRMLFARFLAENGLLIHPALGIPVTLEECAELAPDEGAEDAWALAARYAGAMLPGIFRADDPAVAVRFAPEGRDRLERILGALPAAVFTADDALGWVYQFWQSEQKKRVNQSGRKIGAAELAPVTQLFTEHYMVRFLLENALGAWWAARRPDSPLLKGYDYLRYRDDGMPAAGVFSGWPGRAAEVTMMDPCCGSGHFLVAAFEMLRRMRMEEEGLSEAAAADAVLRDNLHGLELDPRCTQIAAFALALAAWKAGGYRRLPPLNIACSGIGVGGRVEDWTRLAGEDERLKAMLEHLYTLFRDAPTLGSLINPADVPLQLRLFNADYAEVEPLLQRALAKTRDIDDPTAEVFGAAAEGAAKAAALLARTYTLVATNVPYLTRSKQDEALRGYCDQHYFDTKADLATAFIDRCRAFTVPGGSYALVTPQNWLFLGAYSKMRTRLLKEQRWKHISRLGPSAFETISGEVVKAALVILTNRSPSREQALTGIDVSNTTTASGKASGLRQLPLQASTQTDQLHNPDARISLHESAWTALLSTYATCYQGIKTGDDARFRRCFWEFDRIPTTWRLYESTVENTTLYSGREYIVDWRQRGDNIARRQGMAAWGKRGLAVSQMGALAATLYCGDAFDSNAGAIIPKNPLHLAAIWAFCKSPEFSKAVRRIDTALKVTNASLVKVPFDLEQWQAVADAAGPLPEPHSDDPTQWLFEGRPVGATEPLQVAVARLLGYHWPRQGRDDLDAFADADGIVCLPPVAGEPPAAERLRALLAAAYGDEWSTAQAERLLSAAGFGGKGLQAWLRDGFFARHCRLFHNRPFIWQVWDGRNDGFSALVNYHKLDAACLDRLIYTYLGAWIAVQRAALSAEVKPDEAADAEGRLVAALALRKKLEAIRDGEPPYDIYVRWKPLHAQPIGWRPDLNDGVRLNVRPFVAAKALRSAFTVSWNKDRGANPDGSERLNDPHYTRAEKQAAREAAGLSE